MCRVAAIAALGLGLLGGCGGADDSTPVACLEGPSFYLQKGRDGVLISECLPKNQQAGDLATVGLAMLRATTKLNAEARAEPGGAANLQLGYLLGAAERGAEETEGIHDELVRRLTAAARYSPDNRPLPATFLATYKRGFDAGQARG
ncbi:MAG TPA: hypothetical protein VJ989_04745 [Solirubrobacterales bacterium]|nr:hypothetical protein [Solirubrobacterales bacterium]